ncbi:hypothetical protein F7725_022721, partial [Dissostichus mawsoni]
MRQEFDTLRAENVKLKEELQKSTFSYTLLRLTSVVFAWLITKMMGSVERIHNKLTVEDHLLIILMKLRYQNHHIKYFAELVPAMALVLKPLIKW